MQRNLATFKKKQKDFDIFWIKCHIKYYKGLWMAVMKDYSVGVW